MGNRLFIDRTLYASGHIYRHCYLAKEPNIAQVDRDQPFYMVFWIPLKEFFQRKGVAQAIGFLLLFLLNWRFICHYVTNEIRL